MSGASQGYMAHHIPSSALPQPGSQVHGRSLATELLLALRPGQWTKNLLVFAGLIFGQKLLIPADVATAAAAFGLFCLFSGVVYLVNDISDREADRLHPTKSKRPIASGAISVRTALDVRRRACRPVARRRVRPRPPVLSRRPSYVALLTAYSAWLKHSPVLDVLVIAFGFVLRAFAGPRCCTWNSATGCWF